MKKCLTEVVLEDTDYSQYSSTVFYDSSFGSGSSGGSSFGSPGLGSLGDCTGFRNLFSDKPNPSGPLSQPIEPIMPKKEEIEFSYEKPDLSPRIHTPPSCFGSAGDSNMKLSRNTAYFGLNNDEDYAIGVTHHNRGLGKLKIFDKEEDKQYGVPLIDIELPLKKWRID